MVAINRLLISFVGIFTSVAVVGCGNLPGALIVARDVSRVSDGLKDTWQRDSSRISFSGPNGLECVVEEVIKEVKNRNSGKTSIECKRNGNILFKKDDKYSDQILFSHDGKYILGVSKVAIYGDLYLLYNTEGKLINYVTFRSGYLNRFSQEKLYCERTPSCKRLWYDEKNPNVEFIEEDGKLKNILINGCHGDRVSLKDLSSRWP